VPLTVYDAVIAQNRNVLSVQPTNGTDNPRCMEKGKEMFFHFGGNPRPRGTLGRQPILLPQSGARPRIILFKNNPEGGRQLTTHSANRQSLLVGDGRKYGHPARASMMPVPYGKPLGSSLPKTSLGFNLRRRPVRNGRKYLCEKDGNSVTAREIGLPKLKNCVFSTGESLSASKSQVRMDYR